MEDVPLVRDALTNAVLNLPGRNPRQTKAFINLWRFYMVLDYELGYMTNSITATRVHSAEMARLVEIMVRWPWLLDALGARRPVGSDAKTVLADLMRVVEPTEELHGVFNLVDAEVQRLDAAVVNPEPRAVCGRVGAARVDGEEGLCVRVGRLRRAPRVGERVGRDLRLVSVARLHAQRDEAEDEQGRRQIYGRGSQKRATGHKPSGLLQSRIFNL